MNKPSSTDLPSTNVTSQAGPVRNVSLCRRVSEYDPTQLRRAPQVLLPSKKRGHRVSSELISGTAGSGSSDSEAASADPGALRSSPEPGKVPTVVVFISTHTIRIIEALFQVTRSFGDGPLSERTNFHQAMREGDIRLHQHGLFSQVWISVRTDGQLTWIPGGSGASHPTHSGYQLSLKVPDRPTWILTETFKHQKLPMGV